MTRTRRAFTKSRAQRTAGVATALRVALAALLVLIPRVALACPVCFGENDSPLALGINYGILVMLGIIAVLWVAFASFFIHLRRRARMVERAAEEAAAGGSVPGVQPAQGGTI